MDDKLLEISYLTKPKSVSDDAESAIARLENASKGIVTMLLEQVSRIPETESREEEGLSPSRQKLNGIYYTDFSLAREIVRDALRLQGRFSGRFLEPCVGGGAFVFALFEELFAGRAPRRGELVETAKRCFVADNDPFAVEIFTRLFPVYLEKRFGFAVPFPSENVFVGDSLFRQDGKSTSVRNLSEHWGVDGGFDLIITNPPYLLLKVDHRRLDAGNAHVRRTLELMKATSYFNLVTGVPNLYKLFVEVIMRSWLAPGGVTGLLVPRSLLSDSSSKTMRDFLLENFELGPVMDINERNQYFNSVGQAFSAFTAKSGKPTNKVFFRSPSEVQAAAPSTNFVDLKLLQAITGSSAIVSISNDEIRSVSNLTKFGRVRDFPSLLNLRGELDLTLDREYIVHEDTGIPLVKGVNVRHFALAPSEVFVAREFLDSRKGRWSRLPRIACQQISNMNQSKRLKWTFVPPGRVLANSCNFIAIDPDDLALDGPRDLMYLLAILNSDPVEKLFRLTSPNNHISNYEIGSLPVGDWNHPESPRAARLASRMQQTPGPELLLELNKLVLEILA